jgi:hypothetical protein
LSARDRSRNHKTLLTTAYITMKYRPILNGITNGSNCIIVRFLKCLASQYDNVSCINSAGTNENAFSTKHAFLYILSYHIVFSSFNENIQLPEAEPRKVSGGACGAASTAFYAKPETRFPFIDILGNPPVVRIVVDLPAL